MSVWVVEGDLLDQPVGCIVNPWNRNVIPWWLLLPHGVSGAIKRRAGYGPFFELGRMGPIPLGRAVLTGAGVGGGSPETVLAVMREEAEEHDYEGEVRLVVFRSAAAGGGSSR